MKTRKSEILVLALAVLCILSPSLKAHAASRAKRDRILITAANADRFVAVERVKEGLLVCRVSSRAPGFRRGAYWTSFQAYARKRLTKARNSKQIKTKLNKRRRFLSRRCRETIARPIPPAAPSPSPTPDPSECESSQNGLYDYYVDGNSHCSPCSDQNAGTFGAPFCSLQKAATAAKTGTKIYVRAAVYREQLGLKSSGTAGEPIVFKTNPRSRAVISGANVASNWRRSDFDPRVFYSDLPDAPKLHDWMRNRYIKEDQEPLENVRHPKEGWWIVPRASATTLTDPENLRRFTRADDLIGAMVRYYSDYGSTDVVRRITAYDPSSRTVTFDKAWENTTPGRDHYYLFNKPNFISQGGEWAIVTDRDVPRLYLRAGDDQVQNHQYEYAARDAAVHLASQDHTTLEGFEIRDGAYYGVLTYDNANGFSMRSCNLTGNGYMAASLKGDDLVIQDNVAYQNGYGISVTNAKNARIEHNHIFANEVDALLVSWGIDGARVARNFIHDQTSWGHPDGIQTYAGVRNLVIEENVVFNTGQSVMMEDTTGVVIRNNLFAGTGANSVILGHNNTYPVKAFGNTFALLNFSPFGVYAPTKLTDPVRDGFQFDYEFKNNLISAGHAAGYAFSWNNPSADADFNLFWPEFVGATAERWIGNLELWRSATGLDTHSIKVNPLFVSAPTYYTATRYTQLSRRNRVYLWGDVSQWVQGDHIEAGFDGIQRTITAAGQTPWTDAQGNAIKINYIEFTPPLSKAILVESTVSNWKDKAVAETDFRLQRVSAGYPADSPAIGVGEGGVTLGWEADLPALRRSDFDDDGIVDDERYR